MYYVLIYNRHTHIYKHYINTHSLYISFKHTLRIYLKYLINTVSDSTQLIVSTGDTPAFSMTKSFKDALNRSSRPIPGIKDPRAAPPKSSVNPFNLKINKPKFDVLNRSVSGSRGNSVNSRTRAVAVRSATLLPQLQEKNRAHVSSFIDRRFGAKDASGLSKEEVMQERFAKEQQRLATKKLGRKNKFDLNSIKDDEEDDESALSLTHGGRSIEQMDDDELETYDGDDDYQGDEEEAYNARGRSGQLDRDLVSSGHFGGPAINSDEKKSKADVMKELIAKSKFYKMERQKIKEENEALTEDVNEAFAAIRGNLRVLNDEDRKQLRKEEPSASSVINDDEYEATLKELTFDPRSKPSDRTLTPEEREEKEKKRSDEQKKALLERMKNPEDINKEKGNEESDNEDEENIDPELKRIAERQFKLMRDFCHTGSAESYKKLVEYATKQPRTMIQLAKSIRADISKLSDAFTKRSNENGRGAVMPALGPIRLLLLVSRIFSCSDFHHVVATPAQLLLAYYLGVGRMTKLEHAKRALALVYCSLQFQGIGKRCVPEALQILYTLLNIRGSKSDSSSHSHYFCRPLGKSLVEEMREEYQESKPDHVEYSMLFDSEVELSASQLYALTVKLSENVLTNLEEGNYPALKEAAKPFHLLLPKNKCFNRCANDTNAKSLQLQQHKPLALPLLTPDFSADYSLETRKRSGQDHDEQSAARIKRAHKREYKGAVRELKRDAAFLAEHKVKETRRKDAEYKSKINKIIGSIGNGN